MTDERIQIDINRAETDALANVPKIGPYLAEKIIAERPYSSVDELTRVSGIGPRLLELIRPYLTVSTTFEEAPEVVLLLPAVEEAVIVTESQPVSQQDDILEEPWEVAESAVEKSPKVIELPAPGAAPATAKVPPTRQVDDEPLEVETGKKGVEPAVKVEPQAPEAEPARQLLKVPQPPKKTRQYLEKKDLLLSGLIFGLATLVLSAILALALLGIVNGGINYASKADFIQLQEEIGVLQTQNSTLKQDLDGLRIRLDSLEAISGRVNDLEYNLDLLGTDIKKQEDRFEIVETDILKNTQDIEKVTQISEQFNKFIAGLQSLLADIQPPGSK